MTNKKGDKALRTPNSHLLGEVQKSPGRQRNRNAGKGKKGGGQPCRHRTWEIKVNKSHGRQMNRNAAWPVEKGGHEQCRHRTWETKVKKPLLKMLHGQRKSLRNGKLFGE